jgi:low temperature requirement protein LtrA
MMPRSPDEPHRAATPLELLYDLVFVVAVALAAAQLHHGLAEGKFAETLVTYCLAFFGIWWLWMTFTWFASSYDNDDVPYRLLTFMQMIGALIVASGAEALFQRHDLTAPVIGYVIVRISGVIQWLRAARSDPERRRTALRYAVGISLVQVAWVLLLLLPSALFVPAFIVLAMVELLIPVWAEAAGPTPWNEHHIRERYGLFTLLVLGESILSASVALQTAVESHGMNASLTGIIVGALLIVFALWWLYFYHRERRVMGSTWVTFSWAYGHWFIFGATAAVGAGLSVVIDQTTHHAEISAATAGMTVAIPTAIFVIALWILQEQPHARHVIDKLLYPVATVLILLTPFTGQSVLMIGILLALLVVIGVVRHQT